MASPFWFLLLQVDLTQSVRQSAGMCLGKMKTCLLPGVALCLLLVPLVGEWPLCPSPCPGGSWCQQGPALRLSWLTALLFLCRGQACAG